MKYLKPALTAATLILIGGTTVGCGGAPEDASSEDFCDAYVNDAEAISDAGDDKGKIVDAMHDWADKLEEVGTPENISDEEREGFEVVVDTLKDIDEDDADKNPDDLIDGDDKEKADKFASYAIEECADELGDIGGVPTDATELPSDVPTDLSDVPTELPSDVPTELPSDLESQLSEIPTEAPSS